MEKYIIQEHKEIIKEFIIYQVAPNGEVCRRVASCSDIKEAERLLEYLTNKSNP